MADAMTLLRQGLPWDVVRSILQTPSYPEDATRNPDLWGNFRGWQDEARAAPSGAMEPQLLLKQLNDAQFNRGLNLPTYEGHTPGDDDNFGFQRLPSGQYVPIQPGKLPAYNNNPHLMGYFMGQQNDQRQSHMDMLQMLMQAQQGIGGSE